MTTLREVNSALKERGIEERRAPTLAWAAALASLAGVKLLWPWHALLQ